MSVYVTNNDRIPESTTVADILDRTTYSVLSTGYQYRLTDVDTNWEVIVTANSINTLEPSGIGIHSSGLIVDVHYDLSSNEIIRVYDSKYNNTVEGWTNISEFLWNDANCYNNQILNNSSVSFQNITLTRFSDNYISASTVTNSGTASAIDIIANNKVNFSTITFTGADYDELTDNYISLSTVTVLGGDSLKLLKTNTISNSILSIENSTEIIGCSIGGMSTSNMNTGNSYSYCVYIKNNFSNFHADYDFSDTAQYDPLTFVWTVDPLHKNWVGRFRITNNQVGDEIRYIDNCPDYHVFTVVQRSGNDLVITTGFDMSLPMAYPSPFALINNDVDFIELSKIPTPKGLGSGIAYATNYGLY